MNDQDSAVTAFYMMIGLAIRALYEQGETPVDIIETCRSAIDVCIKDDPAVVEIMKRYAREMADQIIGETS